MNANSICIVIVACAVLAPSLGRAQEVIGREANQQRRISQGIGSGQITAQGADISSAAKRASLRRGVPIWRQVAAISRLAKHIA